MEILAIDLGRQEFHIEILPIDLGRQKFHIEILTIELGRQKFHMEILPIELGRQKFHMEILPIDLERQKFHMEFLSIGLGGRGVMPCVGLVLKVLLAKGRGRLPRSGFKGGAEIARRGKSRFKSDVGHGLVGFFEQR